MTRRVEGRKKWLFMVRKSLSKSGTFQHFLDILVPIQVDVPPPPFVIYKVRRRVKITAHVFAEARVAIAFKIIPHCYRNHHSKFEIDRTILTCLN